MTIPAEHQDRVQMKNRRLGKKMSPVNKIALLTFCTALFMAGTAAAKPGDAAKGKGIYDKRCTWCHGAEGAGDGAAKDRLNPPPRDFTSGNYKIRSSDFADPTPNDEDIFRMIRDGMPGTAMPGWSDLPAKQVDYGTQIKSSAESIEMGKKLFEDGDRCVECHGKTGKGSASKRLKGDAGERTWPRNLTKPWIFRGSNDPKDIYTRISTGIAGTEMPSFADPKSKKKLTEEERWHVANYVASLAKGKDKTVNAENTIVKADKVEGELPSTVEDERWVKTSP